MKERILAIPSKAERVTKETPNEFIYCRQVIQKKTFNWPSYL